MPSKSVVRGQLKCDDTTAETRFRLSAKRTSPFKSAGGRQFSRLLAAEVCASAVVMLDTPCSEVVWRVLATHSIRQFPLRFPSRASPCAITFQLESAASGTKISGSLSLRNYRWLVCDTRGLNKSNQENSHLKRIISTNCCIHTVVPPDDGLRYAWNV